MREIYLSICFLSDHEVINGSVHKQNMSLSHIIPTLIFIRVKKYHKNNKTLS